MRITGPHLDTRSQFAGPPARGGAGVRGNGCCARSRMLSSATPASNCASPSSKSQVRTPAMRTNSRGTARAGRACRRCPDRRRRNSGCRNSAGEAPPNRLAALFHGFPSAPGKGPEHVVRPDLLGVQAIPFGYCQRLDRLGGAKTARHGRVVENHVAAADLMRPARCRRRRRPT